MGFGLWVEALGFGAYPKKLIFLPCEGNVGIVIYFIFIFWGGRGS